MTLEQLLFPDCLFRATSGLFDAPAGLLSRAERKGVPSRDRTRRCSHSCRLDTMCRSHPRKLGRSTEPKVVSSWAFHLRAEVRNSSENRSRSGTSTAVPELLYPEPGLLSGIFLKKMTLFTILASAHEFWNRRKVESCYKTLLCRLFQQALTPCPFTGLA